MYRPTNISSPVQDFTMLPIMACRSSHRTSSVARPLCNCAKSRCDLPALGLIPTSSKHCTKPAYTRLHYMGHKNFRQDSAVDEAMLCSE